MLIDSIQAIVSSLRRGNIRLAGKILRAFAKWTLLSLLSCVCDVIRWRTIQVAWRAVMRGDTRLALNVIRAELRVVMLQISRLGKMAWFRFVSVLLSFAWGVVIRGLGFLSAVLRSIDRILR